MQFIDPPVSLAHGNGSDLWAGRRKYIGVRPVLAFWEQCLPITIVFQSESGSFPTVPRENDLEIHRKALN